MEKCFEIIKLTSSWTWFSFTSQWAFIFKLPDFQIIKLKNR